MPAATPPLAIGSVFPDAAEEAVHPAASLWRLWTEGFAHNAAFQTARGALRAVLQARGVRRLWLPAYICDVTLQAPPEGCEVRFYGHGPGLLVEGLAPEAGDAVLGVDYFGRADPALAERAAAAPDVLWIEDRAQALDPGAAAWGEIVLYSPRKLLGVGDGGLLVSNSRLPQASLSAADEPALWTPHGARSLDPDGLAPETWSPVFQAREAAFDARPLAMQSRTLSLLARTAARPLIERRRANAQRLLTLLSDFALWPGEAVLFAPLAVPIRVADAADAVRALSAERIFCARHWADLPSPAEAFPQAHRLSRELVSLPCDQRYDAADMERIAGAVLRLCRPAAGLR